MEEDKNSSDRLYDIVKNSGDVLGLSRFNVGGEGQEQIARALMHPDTKIQSLFLGRYGNASFIGDAGATAIANALKCKSPLQVLWKSLSSRKIGLDVT